MPPSPPLITINASTHNIWYAQQRRYGAQKVAEGVDGAELLTLHEQGLMPLDDSSRDDLDVIENEREGEEEEETPQLVSLPEGIDMEAEGDGETPKGDIEAREDAEGVKDMEDDGEGDDDECEDVEEQEAGGKGRRERRKRKKGVNFASETKLADGPGPNGPVDPGPSTKVSKKGSLKARRRGAWSFGVNATVFVFHHAGLLMFISLPFELKRSTRSRWVPSFAEH